MHNGITLLMARLLLVCIFSVFAIFEKKQKF